MSLPSHPPSQEPSHASSAETTLEQEEMLDLRTLGRRVLRGLHQTIGFGLIGLSAATALYLVTSAFLPIDTSARVVFSFSGYERGQYPDKSKFQPDDLRAPEIIADALKRQSLDSTEKFQSKIRAALTVEGIIPPGVVKERDRLRGNGQTPPPYIPDEYIVTLSLPGRFSLSGRQRELLLNDIVSAFRDRFQRTYAAIPVGFGNAFETLKDADFFEYELILNQEVQNIAAYLDQQEEITKTFRSAATNFTFGDLRNQVALFTQIRLNETLGLIREHGLSKNRQTAMVKMDYYLQTLEDQENKVMEEEKVVEELLTKSQERTQNYVLGMKSQAVQARPETPILDQGLIDSLLANDAYNFLIHQALEAGLKVKRIQAEKSVLLARRKSMETFLKNADLGQQSEIMSQVQSSLLSLEKSYRQLVANIRLTRDDFEHQRFADAVRVSMQAKTTSFYLRLAMAAVVGAFVGVAVGLGLSLLEIYVGAERSA